MFYLSFLLLFNLLFRFKFFALFAEGAVFWRFAGLFASLRFAHDARWLLVLHVSESVLRKERTCAPSGPSDFNQSTSCKRACVGASVETRPLRRCGSFFSNPAFGTVAFLELRFQKKRKRHPCGESGIRTHEALLELTHFPGAHLQPLGHFSLKINLLHLKPSPHRPNRQGKNGMNGFANIARIINSGKNYNKFYRVISPRSDPASSERVSAGDSSRPRTYINLVIAASGVMSPPLVTPTPASLTPDS